MVMSASPLDTTIPVGLGSENAVVAARARVRVRLAAFLAGLLPVLLLAGSFAIGIAAIEAVRAPANVDAACNGWPSSGGVAASGHGFVDYASGSGTWSNGHLRVKLPTSYTCSAWQRTFTYNAMSTTTNGHWYWMRMMTVAGGSTNCTYIGSGSDNMRADTCVNADFSVISGAGISQNTTYTNFGIGYASCSTDYGAHVGWTANGSPGANCGSPATREPDGNVPKFDWTAPSAPTVTLTPGTHAFLSGTTLYVDGTVASSFTSAASGSTDTGGSGLSGYSQALTGTTTGWSPITSTTASQAFSWTTALTDGQTTTLTVNSKDVAGNSSTGVTRTLIADKLAPTISFSAPSAGVTMIASTAYTSTITVADARSGVASWSLTRAYTTATAGTCGTSWTADGTIASGTATVTNQSNPQTLVAGRCYRWTLSASDHVNLATNLTSGSVLVDTTQPVVTFTAPTTGATIIQTATTYTVIWTEQIGTSGAASRSLQRQRGTIVTQGTCAGVTWSNDGTAVTTASPVAVSGLLAGSCYRWTETLTSGSGLQGVATSGSVLVNQAAPTSDFTTPNEGTTAPQSSNGYSVAWTESGSVASRSLQRQRGAVVTPGTCSGVTWANDGTAVPTVSPVATTGLLTGFCYRWTQTLTDGGGSGSTQTSGSIIVDLTAPLSDFVTPNEGTPIAQASTTYSVAWSETEAGSGFGSRSLQRQMMTAPGDGTCQGLAWANDGAPSSSVSPVLSSGLVTGKCYRWFIALTDAVGNSSSAMSGTVIVDAGSPVGDFTTPNEGSTVAVGSGTMFVTWSETDTLSGVTSRSLQRQRATNSAGVCNSTWISDGAAITAAAPALSRGMVPSMCYRWVLTLTDTSGNASQTISGTVRIDRVVLSTPMVNGAIFSLEPFAAVTDLTSVTQVDFIVDGLSVATDTTSPFTASIDTTTMPDGAHQVQVKVTQAGGTTTTSPAVAVKVANGLSSIDRVSSDHDAATLDINTYALDNIYAALTPNSLLPRYRSTTPPTVDLQQQTVVSLNLLDSLDTTTQDTIQTFLNQPLRGDLYQPSSNLGQPEPSWAGCGFTYTTPAVPPLGWPSFTVYYCAYTTAHFNISYIIGPTSTPTNLFVARDDDGLTAGQPDGSIPSNGIPDEIDTLATSLETAYLVYTTNLGFPAPVTGSQRIDIHMQQWEPNNDGMTTYDLKRIGPVTGLGAVYLNPAGTSLTTVPAHELFHVFQYADYRSAFAIDNAYAERMFWYEATANWATYQYVLYRRQGDPAFDADNYWAGNIDVFLATTQYALSDPSGEQRQYGVSLLAHYLTETYPSSNLVRRTWELIAQGQAAKQAISNAVNELAPSSYAAFLENFARRSYELDSSIPINSVIRPKLQTFGTRHPDPDPEFTGATTNRRERPARHVVPLLADVQGAGQLDLGEQGMGYVDLDLLMQGSTGLLTVRAQRPDDNVQAQLVLYRYVDPADIEQGFVECGAPIELTFVNGEALLNTVSVGSPCTLATLVFARSGPSSIWNVLGSHISWSASWTGSIGAVDQPSGALRYAGSPGSATGGWRQLGVSEVNRLRGRANRDTRPTWWVDMRHTA
jgi:Family of unknown function (DUF6055)/Bacterial Ig domain